MWYWYAPREGVDYYQSWMSGPSDKMDFFKAAVVTILLCECPTLTLTKHTGGGAKWDGNYTRMLQTILNQSWKPHRMKQLNSHFPPISKTIQVRLTRYTGHCWRCKDDLVSDVLLCTPYTWTCQCWLTSKNLSILALCGHRM